MITITRKSMFTGNVNTMQIPMTKEMFERAEAQWKAGELIQNAFPRLDPEQREFIKTGVTPAEWERTFGDN